MSDRRPQASGIGSWPGTQPMEAARAVFSLLGDGQIPYLPELPARGVGADLIGRSAGLLIDMAVDLQPSGWRLVPRPGRDLQRAQSWLRQDLDVLAEVADGYTGPLKVQVCGPWTLAAEVWLPRLERMVVDPGAVRDLTASLAAGVAEHLANVRRIVPGAAVVLQIDEPSLPRVLQGALPTASGLSRLRAVGLPVISAGLALLVEAGRAAGAQRVVLHSCAPGLPLADLVTPDTAGPHLDALALDLATLRAADWEALAVGLEAGLDLWAGAVPTSGQQATSGRQATSVAAVVEQVVRPWRGLGLDRALLNRLVVTPACGLAGRSVAGARELTRLTVAAAEALGEESV